MAFNVTFKLLCGWQILTIVPKLSQGVCCKEKSVELGCVVCAALFQCIFYFFCCAIAKGELCRPACENGGRCVANEKGDWRCYCWPDFSGERCEINHCTDYCLNGGTCTGSPLGKKNLYLCVSLSRFCFDVFLWKGFLLWPVSSEPLLWSLYSIKCSQLSLLMRGCSAWIAGQVFFNIKSRRRSISCIFNYHRHCWEKYKNQTSIIIISWS